MPAGWVPNIVNGLVAPPFTGKVRLDYVQMVWQAEVAQAVTVEDHRRLSQFNRRRPTWTSWWRCTSFFFATSADV